MTISEEEFKTKTSYLLPFEKLHGLGNDFVVLNANHLENKDPVFEMDLTKRVCDRNFGIGADGLIVIDAPKESAEAIRSWRYYNSDGSVAEMCGNGIRCAAKYIYEHGLSHDESNFKIETLIGDVQIELLDDELVKVNMGAPQEIKENNSLRVASTETDFQFNYEYVSMGNPHAISFFNDASYEDLEKISGYGKFIETHSDFPNKTNVEFARVINSQEIDLIVWERGCGFTKACGTGACATAVASVLRGYSEKDKDITVHLPGGDLIIRWDSVTNNIFMTGKAVMSFMGYYDDKIS